MRAQTPLDFAIGISIFLIVVVYVLAFVPGVFAPFNQAQEDQTVAVDRVASNLVEGQLAEPADPYVLDDDCTVAFFHDVPENENDDDVYSIGENCRFEDRPLHDRLGINEIRNVYVALVGDVADVDGGEDYTVEVLCYDANDDRIVDGDDASGNECDTSGGDDDVLLEIGGPAPVDSGSVSFAQRFVRFRGHTVKLVVRMW